MIRILILDDHQLIREGLQKVIKKQPDMSVVAEAPNTEVLFAQLERHKVDVIILDISLPGRSGLDVLKELGERYPEIRVLILSMHPEERFASRALKWGAAGYITKDSAAQELVVAIRKITSGDTYISSSLAEKIVVEMLTGARQPLHERLSDREFEVLRLIGSGKSTGEIASELSLSVNTVTTYRARILEKTKLRTNADLIRYALENRLVE